MTDRKLDHPGWADIDEVLAVRLVPPAGIVYRGIVEVNTGLYGAGFQAHAGDGQMILKAPINPDFFRLNQEAQQLAIDEIHAALNRFKAQVDQVKANADQKGLG